MQQAKWFSRFSLLLLAFFVTFGSACADTTYSDRVSSVIALTHQFCSTAYLESPSQACIDSVIRAIDKDKTPYAPSRTTVDPHQMSLQEFFVFKTGLRDVAQHVTVRCPPTLPDDKAMECIESVKSDIGGMYDPHSAYLDLASLKDLQASTQGKFGGLGIELAQVPPHTLLVRATIDDSPAQKAGVHSGDVITDIITEDGGTKRSYRVAELKELKKAIELMRGEPGTPVSIKVSRKNSPELTFRVNRAVIRTDKIVSALSTLDGKTYAVFRVRGFTQGISGALAKSYDERVAEATEKGLVISGSILSLEHNPGGLLPEAYGMSRMFLGTKGDVVLIHTNQGTVTLRDDLGKNAKPVTQKDITNGLPLLVVVDAMTASASEIVSKSLQHYGRAVIAGTSSTFGKGVVQTIIPYAPDQALKVTSSEYLIGDLADWEPVECVGVTPDIEFSYPGVETPKRVVSECSLKGHVTSIGPMPNAPVRKPLKEVNPKAYGVAEHMLKAYIAYRLPQLTQETAERKLIEDRIKELLPPGTSLEQNEGVRP